MCACNAMTDKTIYNFALLKPLALAGFQSRAKFNDLSSVYVKTKIAIAVTGTLLVVIWIDLR